MRAAVLYELGVPTPGEFENPSPAWGQALVDVLAAGVNPVDVSIAAGRFYAGKPPLPLVMGRDGVGCWTASACTSTGRSPRSARWRSGR
jgi:NADPH:quinone reductase-like Zn-dependent oxidoreductase